MNFHLCIGKTEKSCNSDNIHDQFEGIVLNKNTWMELMGQGN